MLPTNAVSDVRTHRSGREVSTGLFLPVTIGNKTIELPRTLTVSQTSKQIITYA
jgi:hypothetical protein